MAEQERKKALQWHSAFYAGLQIEFAEEANYLIFENEHLLGTKPMQMDVLIVKKEEARFIKKNIGRIFRKSNIFEYKSPDDYFSIDDFYKVFGYACFYKSDVEKVDSIKTKEITITFVCERYPRNLLRHFKEELRFEVENQEQGIYYVQDSWFPIQILVTKELSVEQNLW